MLSASK